jgi:hypothetical protein
MIEGGDMDERLSECANVMLSDDVVNEFKELFEVVENDNFDYYAVKLSKGEYVDVVYKYGSIEPEETEDRLNIQFEYNVLVGNSEYTIEQLDESDEFKIVVGKILNFLLYEYLDNKESEDESDGIDNIEESDK